MSLPRNILLITADSIRADWSGFLNDQYDTTPFLADLAEESIVFENAIAPGPRTPSSVPVSFTGEFFRPDGNTRENCGNRLRRVERHVRRFGTIPQEMKQRGYSTAAITANPWTTTTTDFDMGFDKFLEIGSGYGDTDEASDSISDEGRGWMAKISDQVQRIARGTDIFSQWPTFFQQIIQTTTELEEPWFIWVFLLDAHSPYLVPRAYRHETSTIGHYYSAIRYNVQVMYNENRKGIVERIPDYLNNQLQQAYRDSIRSIDAFVKSVYTECSHQSPVLIYHSDHGEAFGEHGTYGHHHQLYEENIHVPFLINEGRSSNSVSSPISLRHLPSVVREIAKSGTVNPLNHCSPIVKSRTEFDERVSLRSENWKFIDNRSSTELYNLEADSDEEENKVDEYHKLADEFTRLVQTDRLHRRERQKVYEVGNELTANL